MNEFRLDLALDLSALRRALDDDDRADDQRAQARGLAKGVYIKALLDERRGISTPSQTASPLAAMASKSQSQKVELVAGSDAAASTTQPQLELAA